MQLTIAPLGAEETIVLPPDIIWSGTVGDYAMASDPARVGGAVAGVGGLVAANPLQSAVIMLLFSDAQCAVADLKLGLGNDRRGWVGDGFDVDTTAGEAPLGSLWWLYRRSTLTELTASEIAAEGQSALQPLITQKAATKVTVGAASVDRAKGEITVDVAVYGRDGRQLYAGQFGPLWARAGAF